MDTFQRNKKSKILPLFFLLLLRIVTILCVESLIHLNGPNSLRLLFQDDNQSICVFVFDSQKQPDKLPLARNALKRFKTIRHPDALKLIEALEV